MPFPFNDVTNDYTPINDLAAVTPNDSTDLPGGVSRGFICTAAGNLVFDTARGTTVTIAIPATATGIVQYIRMKRVRTTSTATVLACY